MTRAAWLAAACLFAFPVLAQPSPPPPCTWCGGAGGEAPVQVLDTKKKERSACCDLVCALRLTAARTSTAIVTIPAGEAEVVKVVRTGKQWTALPATAVFLVVPTTPGSLGHQAFVTQARYIQYLAGHRELIGLRPRPLRLGALLEQLAPAKPASK